MNNNLGMFLSLLGGEQNQGSEQYQGYAADSGQSQQPRPPGTSGTGYGLGLAPWWTGHTDQFMGGMGPLGPEMTEFDARKVLHAINQSYQQGQNPGAQVPWGGGNGGGPNPNVPPQDNSNTPVQPPVQSSTPFMDAYLRAKQRQEEPNI
jgi:hypothetical protein